MNILITGGAGFIGSHLTKRLLDEGNNVVVIDNLLTGSLQNLETLLSNPNLLFVKQDITLINIDRLPPGIGAVDQIYHLASPASPNQHSKISYHALAMETMMVNSFGTLQMLKLAEQQNAKFLFASTSEVYGDPHVNPQPETYLGNVSTLGPRSVYDESKRFGETLSAYYARERQVDARIVRIFNTYGPNLSPADMRMIVNFIHQALKNETITVYGDGLQTRSLCYVDDTVEGLIRLMNYPNTKGEVVNIGSSDEHTVREFAEVVKRITSSTSEIEFTEERPTDDPQKRRADITKAQALLQWKPAVTLEEGLERTVEYVRSVII
ncbi:GDP-mannose 4,6-dehydratase [Candidatus Woesebacteria bacterium]|nr:GDP-mannose 4,6-dehydratase [Candidatus Woesebacteria bacterium]